MIPCIKRNDSSSGAINLMFCPSSMPCLKSESVMALTLPDMLKMQCLHLLPTFRSHI